MERRNEQAGESDMTFSIIIPSHNGASRIAKALDSCISQSFKDFELIVVCDACTDNTVDIARSYNAKVIEVDVRRDGLARNAGIDAAVGDWILFLDDDDWWLHEFVFQQLKQIIGDGSADVINYAVIWKHNGYVSYPPGRFLGMAAGHCWKRSFVADTRFDSASYSSDTHFLDALIAKRPVSLTTALPMYYYNYMREGSLSDLHKKGEI